MPHVSALVHSVAQIINMMHSLGMASTYGAVLAANVRATRVRKDLDQGTVVERMRALGFTNWYRQTISRIERGDRRLAAEEILGLAYALGTNIPTLMGAPDDETIELSTGQVRGADVASLASGRNNGAVRWDGDKPLFGAGVSASWRGEIDDDPARYLV